jgi:hypothetical protein
VQTCQRIGAKFFCTVSTVADAMKISAEFNVDKQSVAVLVPGDDLRVITQKWLTVSGRTGFDIIFNTQGSSTYTTGIELLEPMGHYIHNQSNPSDQVNIPSGAPTTHVINIPRLVEHYPAKMASTLSTLLVEHSLAPLRISSQIVTLSQTTSSAIHISASSTPIVVIPEIPRLPGLQPTSQLFNPHKSYILLGGSSELGVRIACWMVSRGARSLVLTSRRGPKALTKIDLMYLHYLQMENISVEVIAADARSREDMLTTINRANEIAQVDGILLMTVVLRDAAFSHLNQESFDDVYLSKVHILNTLLSCVNTADLGFLLLFSTIASVFGNAGQAAYCASQS